jgi:hypothetical protein
MFITPPRGSRRLPWLGVLAMVLVLIGLWLQRGTQRRDIQPAPARTPSVATPDVAGDPAPRPPEGTSRREPAARTTPPPERDAPAPTAGSPTPATPARPEGPAARPEPPVGSTVRESRVFGPGVGFRSRERWMEHWDKHGAEFAQLEVRTPEDYLAAAQALRDGPPSGWVLEAVRADGVVTLFDQRTNSFLAYNRDGTIRTFFRPNDGVAYFRRQAQREP